MRDTYSTPYLYPCPRCGDPLMPLEDLLPDELLGALDPRRLVCPRCDGDPVEAA